MQSHTLALLTGVAIATGAAPACSSTPKAQRYDDVLSGGDQRVEVEVDRDVARACNLPDGLAYFEVGSDWLDDRDKSTIHRLALCMRDGPLADRDILLTGYTDRTGEDEHNLRLGFWRAGSVADELRTHGIPADRIYIRSRGEREARATSTFGMARERTVVLALLEDD